jgi:tetratricopeptide (TPR) repeat protein
MKRLMSLLYFTFFLFAATDAQDVNYLLNEGAQLEKDLKDGEALKKYQEALLISPTDLKALNKCSELNSVIGNRQPDKKQKMEYFNAAKTYAETALKINEKDADANFVMAMAMGRIALISGGKEKVERVKDIKKYADNAIEADPNHYKSLHLLGKWNMEVSSLNVAEKAALKIIYGGLPPASVPTAIEFFEKARKANPNFILNYLELAKAYKTNGQSDKAIEVLNRMVKLPPRSADDNNYKAEGKNLLESLL